MSENKDNKQKWSQYLLNEIKQLLSITDAIDIEQSSENIRQNVPFRGPNVVVLICAIIIASVGLNVNSIPVIIGAMLISPLMGPIVGLGLGVGTNDVTLLKQSLKHLTIMVIVSLLASTLYFLLSPLSLDNPSELLNRTNPSIYDVLIAFFGGAAGILETSRKDKGTTAAGVAIATALMPPLCTVGYGIANLEWQYIIGAFYLFIINSVFIASAAFIGVKWMRYPMVHTNEKDYRRNSRIIGVIAAIVMIPSIMTAVMTVFDHRFQRDMKTFVETHRSIGKCYVYDYSINTGKRNADIYLLGEQLSDADRTAFFAEVEGAGFALSQFILHEEATTETIAQLDENLMVKDVLNRQERQMREKDALIDSLKTRLNEYRDAELPNEQIISELRAQLDNVEQIHILRGAQTTASDSLQSVVWVVIDREKNAKKMTEENKLHLQNWLKVRLGEENVNLSVR